MEASSSNTTSSSETMRVVTSQRKGTPGIRLDNPFTLKVGQVFTGFGVGCGVGIGVGRPINLGAVPVLNQVMSATRGATDAFSGISRHVNGSMRKLGAKNIEAGVGCGVGFGHGFGIGLAIKPSVLNQVQACLMQTMEKMMIKLGMNPNVEMGQRASPISLQTGMSLNELLSHQIPVESRKHIAAQNHLGNGNMATESGYSNVPSSGTVIETPFGTRTEKVISSFLQNPVLKGGGDACGAQGEGGQLEVENKMVQMVMKHEELIEKLMEENKKLRRRIVGAMEEEEEEAEERFFRGGSGSCSECFECRRKHRKRK